MLQLDQLKMTSTVELMQSDCFRDRMRAEYYQTAIRKRDIDYTIEHYDDPALGYIPGTSKPELTALSEAMAAYLVLLANRCKYEGADLDLPLTYLHGETCQDKEPTTTHYRSIPEYVEVERIEDTFGSYIYEVTWRDGSKNVYEPEHFHSLFEPDPEH